jgi:hypothetical protein
MKSLMPNILGSSLTRLKKMNKILTKILLSLASCLGAVILMVGLTSAPGQCEKLRFVFIADSRGDSVDCLINTPALASINSQILALKPLPSFVVYGGDQAYLGHSGEAYNFWLFKYLMKPLTDKGIKLYTVLGNHELCREEGRHDEWLQDFYLKNQQEFQKVFTDNPDDGPLGYERLVFSFSSPEGDALFVCGDCYYLTQDTQGADLHGNIDATQLSWISQKLTQSKATHKFFFVHAPYYQIISSSTGQNPSWTQLWNILDNNLVELFCCGHTHLFSRKTINYGLVPDPQIIPPLTWQHNITQLLTGTCGAPVDTDEEVEKQGKHFIVNKNVWHVFNNENRYYFSVVDIDGRRVTVTSYGGPPTFDFSAYQIVDKFVIPINVAPINSLLLLDKIN